MLYWLDQEPADFGLLEEIDFVFVAHTHLVHVQWVLTLDRYHSVGVILINLLNEKQITWS